jgi:uroporphyrinogen decarboxylase
LLDLHKARLRVFLDEVGEYLDMIEIPDDLAMQDRLFMSPRTYREMIKPYHAEYFAFIKEYTEAKILYHCCGNIYPLIDDLIEIGIDVLNPVQVSAGDMGDTAKLKHEFGGQLAFCGGIDTQSVLPFGTPEDVRAEVRKRIRDLAPGGGYLLAAVHSIQNDVPAENIVAMFQSAQELGRYPLDLGHEWNHR